MTTERRSRDGKTQPQHRHAGFWRGADAPERATLVLGPVLFACIVVGEFFAAITDWHGMTFGDYIQGVAAGAGLLAIGHGIHRHARLRRDR
jgi:small ligand-binding sensory domain FIST